MEPPDNFEITHRWTFISLKGTLKWKEDIDFLITALGNMRDTLPDKPVRDDRP